MTYGTNAPVGFVPEKYLNNSTWSGQFGNYQIVDAYATSLFLGDPVTLTGGYLIIGATSAPLVGIFAGCSYVTLAGINTFSPYWPASTSTLAAVGATAQVVDDPNVLFNVQLDATAADQVDIGENANFVSHAGNTVTGISGYALGDPATGNATYNFKVNSLVPVPNNVFGTTYNNVFVTINNHIYKGGTGTVGV